MSSRRNPLVYAGQTFNTPSALVEHKLRIGDTDAVSGVSVDDRDEALEYLRLFKGAASQGRHRHAAPQGARPPVRPTPPAPAPEPRNVPWQEDVPPHEPPGEAYESEDYEPFYEEEPPRPAPRPAARRPAQAPEAAPRQVKREDAEVSYRQGLTIGCSIGGMEAYCKPQPNESHAQALTRGGLTRGKASMVIQALIDAGVAQSFYGRDPRSPEARKAQKILTEVGGFTCRI